MPALTEEQKEALGHWYRQSWLLEKALSYLDEDDWLGMEDYMHRDALIPIARRDEIPDFLRDENGEPYFPYGINPAADLEGWQDAVEVGWAVMKSMHGIDHDRVHEEIAAFEKRDWADFLQRAEERENTRG